MSKQQSNEANHPQNFNIIPSIDEFVKIII